MVWDTSICVRGFEVTQGRVFTMLSRWEQQGMVERLDRGVYKKSYRQEVLQPYQQPYELTNLQTYELTLRVRASHFGLASHKLVGKTS